MAVSTTSPSNSPALTSNPVSRVLFLIWGFRETKKVVQSTIQDMIDLIIPLSLMGMIDVSPGVVGLAGTVTSILGAISAWPASPKDKSD